MPADKPTKSNTSKPLTPALSSNFRNVKSPLTPRVAGSPTPSSSQPFVRAKSPAKPDQTTTPLGGNVTPRSAARKSRADTESPLAPAQPRVPPNGRRSRASSGNEAQKSPGQVLGITSPRLVASTPTLAKVGPASSAPVVTIHRRISAAKSAVEGNKDVSSKFFHASEVKSALGSPGLEESHRFPPKPGHFFVGSPPLAATRDHASGRSEPDEKFFRANDIPQNAQSKRTVLPHISTDRLNSSAGRGTPPQSPKKSHGMIPAEPSSPRKFHSGPTASPVAPRTTAERPKSTSSGGSPLEAGTHGHRKSLSADSKTSQPTRKLSGPRAQVPQPLDLRLTPTLSPHTAASILLSPTALSPRSISLNSTNTITTSVTSDTDLSEIAVPATLPLASPSDQKAEPPATPVQPQVDLASNARRERKVLDLEISNSSLLAINKTLERELRKQSTELRRYRRLSRSGRISIAPSARSVSEQTNFSLDTVTEIDGEGQHLSDLDEESDLSDYDDEDSSLLSNDSGSLTSPSARSRQRARDEKRLMQDLSRHQQLLVDSQRLSQSIKRCLTCTDDLIREGNKALEYRVGIGDVKLGGRVLSDDELDERGLASGVEEVEARQGLLSPSVAKANLDHAQLWAVEQLPLPSSGAPEHAKDAMAVASLGELTDLLESVNTELRIL
ncbi:hypothetical protein A1O7_01307 [Cladophialophora yegresii CBS 114405]|uniref:Uncharacterized protein n=1 Tax=Cladophialophora yegresii CBS 114405 TaxID=1182544 RepID=W9WAK9_9EURO|nr:uncharacterized protein A1O7_01307 [Cladophialophora yegresii CBS 114405]EXJ64968.1 hypothetical protein A1O7_01307 [Cladophialophora yegresii CBS 114405]